MLKKSETFNIAFDSIPHFNVRNEFARYYECFRDSRFIAQFIPPLKPIDTPYMTWYGMPDDLLTIILQRLILGLESYLPTSVYYELGIRGLLQSNIQHVKNPFSLGSRSTVDNYYHKLPSLIDEQFSLMRCDNYLYQRTKIFYKEVRNPIFHGHNISHNNIQQCQEVVFYMSEIYTWIDLWHDPSCGLFTGSTVPTESSISGGDTTIQLQKNCNNPHITINLTDLCHD